MAETNALGVITRRYDAQGLPSEFSVDTDAAIAYAYDDLKRLTNVSVGGLAFGCAYLPQTRVQVSASNSCGSGWSRSYEGGRNLIATVTNFHGSTVVASYAYGNDALGRRAVRNGDTFAYNARSELTNATVSADVYGYGYDGIGNLLFSAVGTVTNTYAANALNQYTAITGAESVSPSYDADGNMLTNGVWAYTWDAENRLNSVEADGVTLVSNDYDYLGRRFRKTSGAVTRTFVYDGWNLCREVEASGGVAVTNIYVWGLDLSGTVQGAGGVGGLLAVLRNGTPYFPCYDANGNVTDYADAGGAVVAHREYDPFGRTTAATGPLVHELHFWFSTKYLDEEAGLYYYGYRFYAPERMRWLSRDPIEERGGSNLYEFVGNEPFSNFEILGQKWTSQLMGVDFYFAYEIVVPLVINGVPSGNHHEVFHGGRAFPEFTKYIEPVIVQNDEGCYCVKQGTGIAEIMVKWWKTKNGVPSYNDLSDDLKEKWNLALQQGLRPRLLGATTVGVFENNNVVDYVNWHEATEVAANGVLYENTLGIAEKRAQSALCYNTKNELDKFLRWKEALKAYSKGVDMFKNAFDPRYAPKRMSKNGKFVLVTNTPAESYNVTEFSHILSPMKWD